MKIYDWGFNTSSCIFFLSIYNKKYKVGILFDAQINNIQYLSFRFMSENIQKFRDHDSNALRQIMERILANYDYPSKINGLAFIQRNFYALGSSKLAAKTRFITTLVLRSCCIGNNGIRIIQKADWKFISKLNLRSNSIDEQGVLALSNCKWKYLTVLILSYNLLRNKGFQRLMKGNWPYLTVLQLQFNKFTSAIWKIFIKNHWHFLKKIVVFETRQTRKMAETLLDYLYLIHNKFLQQIYINSYRSKKEPRRCGITGIRKKSLQQQRMTPRQRLQRFRSQIKQRQIVRGEWERIHYVNNVAKANTSGYKVKLSIELYRLESESLIQIQKSCHIYFKFIDSK